jgi:O-antigen ligase
MMAVAGADFGSEKTVSWKLHTRLALACLVFAPVDVFDILGNASGIHLTPFLLLSACYAMLFVAEVLIAGLHNTPSVPRDCFEITESIAILLILIMACSLVFLSRDPLSAAPGRLVYTGWLLIIAVLLVNRERHNFPQLIVRSCRVFVVFNLVAIIAQIASFFSGYEFPEYFYGLSVKGAANIPRFNGVISDPNLSSVVLVLAIGFAFMSGFELPSSKRLQPFYYWAGLIPAFLTISRTGIVSIAILLLIMLGRSRNRTQHLLRALLVTGICASFGITYLASKNLIQPTKEIIADLIFSSAEREESTSIHLQLIKDGLQLVAENPKVLLIGTGWGTEYENTRSFFPDTKYGNFHNTYISFVTQSGILSLICILALLIRPLVLKYPWGVLALVFLWSGLFYQYHGEPLWWILLIAMNKRGIQSSDHVF